MKLNVFVDSRRASADSWHNLGENSFKKVLWEYEVVRSIEKLFAVVTNRAPDMLPFLFDRIVREQKVVVSKSIDEPDWWMSLVVLINFITNPTCTPNFCQRVTESFLIHRIGYEPQEPSDYVRSTQDAYHCYDYRASCKECRAVRKFLLDPKVSQQHFNGKFSISTSWKEYVTIKKDSDGAGMMAVKTIKRWKETHCVWKHCLEEFRSRLKTRGKTLENVKVGRVFECIF